MEEITGAEVQGEGTKGNEALARKRGCLPCINPVDNLGAHLQGCLNGNSIDEAQKETIRHRLLYPALQPDFSVWPMG